MCLNLVDFALFHHAIGQTVGFATLPVSSLRSSIQMVKVIILVIVKKAIVRSHLSELGHIHH